MTNIPLVGNIIDDAFFENDDMIYLPMDKNITIQREVKIHRPSEIVLPSQVVEYFIERSEHFWIMDHCICRESTGCEDYPRDIGCLFLGEATKDINPLMGRSVTKKEAFEHVDKARKAGLVHLIGRNKLDPVWLGVGPDDKFLTICNCCSCCCLWRMIPDLSPDISAKIKRMPGVSVSIDPRCVGCGKCADICFVDAIEIIDGKATVSDECRGCSRCVYVCSEKAIKLTTEEINVDDFISRIESTVDLS